MPVGLRNLRCTVGPLKFISLEMNFHGSREQAALAHNIRGSPEEALGNSQLAAVLANCTVKIHF